MAVNSEEKYVSLVRNPSVLFFLAESNKRFTGVIVILPCVCRRDLQFLSHFYPQ